MGGFQFTPSGLLPLEAAVPNAAQADPMKALAATSSAFVAHQEQALADETADFNATEPGSAPPPRQVAKPNGAPPKPLRGRGFVAEIRARIRELDAALRQAERYRKERDELKRLIAAATGKTKRTADGQPLIGRNQQITTRNFK